jgi:hypothetical protein
MVRVEEAMDPSLRQEPYVTAEDFASHPQI